MKDEIIHFLKENIIGKTLLTCAVYKLENGNLEGVYNDKMTFSNLVTTENGFKFDMTTVTQELVYNLDDKGARTTIAKDYTGTSVFCYELAMRKKHKANHRLYALCFNNSSRFHNGSRSLWNI